MPRHKEGGHGRINPERLPSRPKVPRRVTPRVAADDGIDDAFGLGDVGRPRRLCRRIDRFEDRQPLVPGQEREPKRRLHLLGVLPFRLDLPKLFLPVVKRRLDVDPGALDDALRGQRRRLEVDAVLKGDRGGLAHPPGHKLTCRATRNDVVSSPHPDVSRGGVVPLPDELTDVAEVHRDRKPPRGVGRILVQVQRVREADELAANRPRPAVPIHVDFQPAAHVSSVIVRLPRRTTSLVCSSPLPAWSTVHVGSRVPTMLPRLRPASMENTP